jgi:hypothetical protein
LGIVDSFLDRELENFNQVVIPEGTARCGRLPLKQELSEVRILDPEPVWRSSRVGIKCAGLQAQRSVVQVHPSPPISGMVN